VDTHYLHSVPGPCDVDGACNHDEHGHGRGQLQKEQRGCLDQAVLETAISGEMHPHHSSSTYGGAWHV